MTPAAMTPAAKAATKKPIPSSPAGATAVPGHRRSVRAPAAPRSPRRVSGPSTGRAGAATAPAPRAPSVPRSPAKPRRPAAPRRAPARRRVARRIPASSAPLGARVLGYIRALPDHALLDRVIRGRAWIPILGVMLAGIVFMQVEVLKLGANMGRAIQRGTALQSTNEQLRASVATLADDQRIERLAASRGMLMPTPAGVGFLSAASGTHAQRAIANIHPPSPTGFLAMTTTNGIVTTSQTASASQTGSSATSSTGSLSSAGTAASAGTATSAATPTSTGTATSAGTSTSTGTPVAPTTSGTGTAVSGAAGAAVSIQPASTQSSASGTTGATSGGAAIPSGN
jgi:hypothetical protein